VTNVKVLSQHLPSITQTWKIAVRIAGNEDKIHAGYLLNASLLPLPLHHPSWLEEMKQKCGNNEQFLLILNTLQGLVSH
jgi:hypothetical protein